MKILISSSAIIYNHRNQVLIAKRSSDKKIDPGLWEIIGGAIEFGETPLECLEREISEELDCKLSNIKLLDIYSFVNPKLERQIISIQYIATIDEFPKFNTEEIAELKWIDESDIPKLKFSMNCKKRIADYYRHEKIATLE
jgi:8-oxo-dGTP diphosphatase